MIDCKKNSKTGAAQAFKRTRVDECEKDPSVTEEPVKKVTRIEEKKLTKQEKIKMKKMKKIARIKAKSSSLLDEPPLLSFKSVDTVPGSMYVFVDDERTCRDALRNINAWKNVAVDCEGGNLGRDGTLSLIQVATPDHKAYIFDVHTPELRNMIMDSGLRKVLESRKILKYMHDCRRDSDALWHHAQTKLHNVLDTQIAHAVLLHMEKKLVSLPVGLGAILKFVN